MNLGTMIVAAGLAAVVMAIIVHIVRLASEGKHIGCEACSSNSQGCSGACQGCGETCQAASIADDIEKSVSNASRGDAA